MYYLESKEPSAGGKPQTKWMPVCYCDQREPLDEAVETLGSENFRVTPGTERRCT